MRKSRCKAIVLVLLFVMVMVMTNAVGTMQASATNNNIPHIAFPIKDTNKSWGVFTYAGHGGENTRSFSAVDIARHNNSKFTVSSIDGQTVVAVADGVVRHVDRSQGMVLIRHTVELWTTNGRIYDIWWSVYGHMKDIPKDFDNYRTKTITVKKGQTIGKVSNVHNIRNSNGQLINMAPHLHFALYQPLATNDSMNVQAGTKSLAISPYYVYGFAETNTAGKPVSTRYARLGENGSNNKTEENRRLINHKPTGGRAQPKTPVTTTQATTTAPVNNTQHFTITLDPNGGTVSPRAYTLEQGTFQLLPTPTKQGYRFDGWANSSGQRIGFVTVSKDETLTAQWTETSTATPQTPSQAPATITLSNIELLSTGETRAEFRTRLSREGMIGDYGYEIREGSNGTIRSHTLTANTRGTIITLDTQRHGNISLRAGTTHQVRIFAVVDEVRITTPWRSFTTARPPVTTPSTTTTTTIRPPSNPNPPIGTTPVQRTLTLNPNGGTVSQTTFTVDTGSRVTLPIPTREGFAFDGWYHNGNRITASSVTLNANATLIAHWIENTTNTPFTTIPDSTTTTTRATTTTARPIVPTVVGENRNNASNTIRAQGLNVTVEEELNNNGANGSVIRQTPAAGTSVNAGSTVTITVTRHYRTEWRYSRYRRTESNGAIRDHVCPHHATNSGFGPVSSWRIDYSAWVSTRVNLTNVASSTVSHPANCPCGHPARNFSTQRFVVNGHWYFWEESRKVPI